MLNFLNSTNRSYNGQDLNKINEAILSAGVLDTTGTDFEVTKTTGLDVSVAKGALILTVESAGSDTNVMGVENSTNVLTCTANATNYIIFRAFQSIIDGDTIDTNGTNSDAVQVVTTLPATDPYVLLATVVVPNGATSLTDNMITDNRVFANIKQYMIDEIIEKVYENNPINDLDTYSDGISTEQINGNDLITNIGGDTGQVLTYSFETPTYLYVRSNQWQLFTAPSNNISELVLKKGIHEDTYGSTPMTIGIYTVNGSNNPNTMIEQITVSSTEWNDVGEFTEYTIPLTGSYTASTQYGVYIECQEWGSVQRKNYFETQLTSTDPNIGNLYTHQKAFSGTFPTEWLINSNNTLTMRLVENNETALGETNSTGKQAKLAQTFIAETNVIRSIILKKGVDVGTPTENISFKIYKADVSDEPTGDLLGEMSMTSNEWNSISDNSEFEVVMKVAIEHGKKHILVIEPEGLSNTNYRTLWAGKVSDGYSNGKLRGHNNVDGYFDINYDLYFKIKETPAGKLVRVPASGILPPELFGDALNDVKPQLLLSNASAFSVSSYTSHHIDVCTSLDGKFLILYQRALSASTVYVFKRENGIFSKIKQLNLTNGQPDGWHIGFGENKTVYISANRTSYNMKRIWEIEDIENTTTTTINYLGGLEVYGIANTVIASEFFYKDGFIYMNQGGADDYYKINVSDWTLDSIKYNVFSIQGNSYMPTSRDLSGNIILSNGDIYKYDGNTTKTLLYSAATFNEYKITAGLLKIARVGHRKFVNVYMEQFLVGNTIYANIKIEPYKISAYE